MRKRSSNILILLIGLSLGALVGILFSPTGGATIRSLLLYQLKKLLQKIKILFVHLTHFPRNIVTTNSAKLASQEVIDRTIRKAKKLLEEAKTLSDQLDAKNINL